VLINTHVGAMDTDWGGGGMSPPPGWIFETIKKIEGNIRPESTVMCLFMAFTLNSVPTYEAYRLANFMELYLVLCPKRVSKIFVRNYTTLSG
jgi:hypothetical protein